jgi:hypothetical protein
MLCELVFHRSSAGSGACLFGWAAAGDTGESAMVADPVGAENPVMATELVSHGRPSWPSGCASTSRSGTVRTRDTSTRLFSGAPPAPGADRVPAALQHGPAAPLPWPAHASSNRQPPAGSGQPRRAADPPEADSRGTHLRVPHRSLTTQRCYGKRRSRPESYFRAPQGHGGRQTSTFLAGVVLNKYPECSITV